MSKTQELEDLFFKELKSYNTTNFRTLLRTDLHEKRNMAVVHKAFSSVVTRYFIFREKHSEDLTDSEFNMLYFTLKLDLISQYFATYPDSDTKALESFQDEVRKYNDKVTNVKHRKEPSEVPDRQLVSDS